MLRRFAGGNAGTRTWMSAERQTLNQARCRCATKTEEGALKKVVKGESASSSSGAASANAPSGGRQLHRWRSDKDVVYMKGVAVKGSLFKLGWIDQLIILLVFSLAGTGAVFIVRPQIRYLCHHGFMGLTEDAGWVNGPWLYRFVYFSIMYPSYSIILMLVGTVFGRRVWFAFMVHKMWSRFLTKGGAKRLEYLLDIQHY